jgi:hypothetical protein
MPNPDLITPHLPQERVEKPTGQEARLDREMHGPRAPTRAYTNKMLLAALLETQTATRSYDNKAQIVGVGYMLALGLVLHFGDLLPRRAPLGPLFFAVVWGVIILPILQFGQVLYPSRSRAEKELLPKTSCASERPVFYVEPDAFADVKDFVQQALKSDWTSVLSAELLKTSRNRLIKQTRFRRGLMMVVVSFIVLASEQFLRSLAVA